MRVAFVLPERGQHDLTRLAIDAIQRFTEQPKSIHVIPDKTWIATGSLANAKAVESALDTLRRERPSHVFAMHTDALPVKRGWLDFLLSRPEPMVGYKASQRSGFPHAAGILFDFDFLAALPPGALRPNLPAYDALEGAALHGPHWSAWSFTVSPGIWPPIPVWMQEPGAEVGLDDTGEVFYVHRGGGTLNGGDHTAWIRAAREALDL